MTVWGCAAPSCVRFFGWLLVQRRVHMRDVLLRKTIVTAEEAVCPICGAVLETADHMIFVCPFARAFWRSVGIEVAGRGYHVGALQDLDVRVVAGNAATAPFILLCCWQLWKHRNAVVFRAEPPSLARLLGSCREDAALWRGRLKDG